MIWGEIIEFIVLNINLSPKVRAVIALILTMIACIVLGIWAVQQ